MLDRRQFLSSLALLCPSTRVWAKGFLPIPQVTKGRERQGSNIFIRNGKPLLLALEGNDARLMLARGFERLPQLEDALHGKRVLIKPNATASQPCPVTTDVALLRAVVQYVKRAGALSVTIRDSSSFAGFANDRVFGKLGYYALAKEESVRAAAIDSQVGSEYVRVANPEWKANPFLLTDRLANEADFVINLAIPKRHHAADFSCALKNNFGCTYGTFRMLAHLRGDEFFDNSVGEFADAVRPNLTIVDARWVVAKSGPGFRPGESEILAARRMILSGDMVAADSYCGRLMEKVDLTFNMARRLQRQLQHAQRLGLGEGDLAQAELVEI